MKSKCYLYLDAIRTDYVNAFKKAITSNTGLSSREIHNVTINSEAPQWYCSIDTALKVIHSLEKEQDNLLNFANPYKRKKYQELFIRYSDKKKESGLKPKEILEEIIYSPAPSFFISYNTARMYLLLHRKQLRHEKNKHSIRQY